MAADSHTKRTSKHAADTLDSHIRRRIKARLSQMPTRPTQDAIGAAIGKSQTWVSHYFNADIEADFETASRLCEFLGTTLAAEINAGADAKIKTAAADEYRVLFASVVKDEQETVLEILRKLARRPASRRARTTR